MLVVVMVHRSSTHTSGRLITPCALRHGENTPPRQEVLRLHASLLNYALQSHPGNLHYVNHCLGQCASVLAKRSEEVGRAGLGWAGLGWLWLVARCHDRSSSLVHHPRSTNGSILRSIDPTHTTRPHTHTQHILQQAPLDAECVDVIERLLTLPLASLALKVPPHSIHRRTGTGGTASLTAHEHNMYSK